MAKALRSRHLVAFAFGSAAMGLPATPAQAQASASAAVSSISWSKTQAILGGAPSALQAILAQQQGLAAAPRAPLQPASYATPQVTPAIVRTDSPPFDAGARTGRPDVFGTVALRVGSTRLDARWNRVEHAGLTGPAARYAAALRDMSLVERLEAVNRYVNHRVRFADDAQQYGRADVWSAASDTLRKGRGDCEDYAIAKLQMLRRAGISDRDLYLVIVRDLVSRADHAVLVARADDRMLVLDNGTDRVFDSYETQDYRPVLTFAATGTWTHGYRVNAAAPVVLASADVPSAAPIDQDAGDQRSWSASLLAFNAGFSR